VSAIPPAAVPGGQSAARDPGAAHGARTPEFATVAELIGLYRKRAASPLDVVRELIARIERYESSLHCFVTRTPEHALARARDAEARIVKGESVTPLTGIPYGLKDVINTAGVLTTGQSRIFEHNVPDEDAAVEARLKQAGGVLLGKLTTFELAHGGPSWDLPWPPAMNPWKAGYLPGNTSSGPGAAVAAGLLPFAIGTDTGGSIRMPAAQCGIVGVKPTFGLVSRRGVLPNTFTFDTCGPMTRTVEDAAIVLAAIAGYDDEDISSVERDAVDYTSDLARGVKGVRVGWVRHWYEGDPSCHPDLIPAMNAALKSLQDAGAIVEEVELSELLVYQDCKTTISITEMFSAYEHEFRTRPQDFGLMYRNKVLAGALIRAEDYFQALRQRLWLSRELARAFRAFDVLATASWLTPAEPAAPDKLQTFLRPPNITTPFNVGGQPAMSIPCGFTADGLPLSLQLATRHFDEALMFRVGHAYQQMTQWHTMHPTDGMVQ
jgi:aspartyl-tRNA(Asn)/glutamyl-tRNA(Gln) amidotransferase subunit A